MAKTKQTYNKTSTVTPKGEAIWPALVTPDEQSDKFQIGVEVVEGSSEWEPVLSQLLSFQNKCLREAGEDESDSLLCLKPIKEKDEKTEKYVDKGRRQIIFKSADRSKFKVVGADKKPFDDEVNFGATVRVNGTAAFGFMKSDPYVTLYINAVQVIENGSSSGVDAFDDETGGSDEGSDGLNDETDHDSVDLA